MELVQEKIKRLQREIVKAVSVSREGHLPSALSILDILFVLYDRVLHTNPALAQAEERDRFFLSKGHASVGLYAVLAEMGFFAREALVDFCTYESQLGGHPDRNKVFGVEASTGSLGHGLPMAVGVALGLKIRKNPARVFVLIGDGEANEGTVWESFLLAAHHNLGNLCVIMDHNHSTDRALVIGDVVTKVQAFDWQAMSVSGHDHEEIYAAVTSAHSDKPLLVVAETIKGHGVKSLENDPAWHHRSPTAEELENFLEELV